MRPHKPRKFRYHRPRLVVIGLTGSIAMGKSTAAQFLRGLGLPVFNADTEVHRLLSKGGAAVAPVRRRFPEAAGPNGVDRAKLGALVFSNPAALADLEAILHPMVHRARARFIQTAVRRGAGVAAMDVPLLLEGEHQHLYDVIAVVSAPAFLQRQRALGRPGMTEARLRSVLARQMPDARKRAAADVIIPTGLGKRETLRRLKRMLRVTRQQSKGRHARNCS